MMRSFAKTGVPENGAPRRRQVSIRRCDTSHRPGQSGERERTVTVLATTKLVSNLVSDRRGKLPLICGNPKGRHVG